MDVVLEPRAPVLLQTRQPPLLERAAASPRRSPARAARGPQICQAPPRSTGTRSPSAVIAGHLELRAADHEVDVRGARVDALRGRLVPDGEGEAVAERDVRRRVLVEQRVVEDGAERPDAALAVDERELAEPGGALVERREAAERAAVLVGVDLDRAAALEAHAQAADDRAVAEHERLRRGDVPVGARGIGGREDLLGRQVRQVPDPVDGLEVGGPEERRRQQPDGQVGAGPLEVDRVEAALAQRGGVRLQRRRSARATAATGSGSSRRSTCSSCCHSRS